MQTGRLSRTMRVDWALALERPTLDEPALRVDGIMSRDVFTCRPSDPLSIPAQIMWERDCGCVPVIDGERHVVGMITDRDICMAAYTQGKSLHDIAVDSACAHTVISCRVDELVSQAAQTMARAQVRRLPVLDAEEHLAGVLSLSDLIRHESSARSRDQNQSDARLSSVLEAVSLPRVESTDVLVPMSTDERERLAEYDLI